MTSNAVAIRQAVFARALVVPPSGAAKWALARQVALPTMSASDVPCLQVLIGRERYDPQAEDNTGPVSFLARLTISITILRGLDDPLVLDGQADDDLANVLDAVLQDNSFTNPDLQVGFRWEGIPSIDLVRGAVVEVSEANFYAASAQIVFTYRIEFVPAAPNWLEEIGVTAKVGDEQFTPAEFEVGEVNYVVIGPAGGIHGSPSTPFVVNLESGASFTGHQTVLISDGGKGGTFTPSVGAVGVGSILVKPANLQTSFRFTYEALAAGNVMLTFANLNGWNNPPAALFTAT